MKNIFPDWTNEKKLYDAGVKIIAGIDEAGRGPFAGPVVAACVILPAYAEIAGVNDSKKLSEKKRAEVNKLIIETAVSIGVAAVDEKRIDEINILNATREAMMNAALKLKIKPDHVLIDGLPVHGFCFNHTAIPGGDAKSVLIAAASIVAKMYRDGLMIEYDKIYPEYGFAKHKGYGTVQHIEAIKKYGPCPIHRRTFIKKFIG